MTSPQQTVPPPAAAPAGTGDPTSVMGRRIGAWIIDVLILAVIVWGVVALTLDYSTLSAEGAQRLFGEQNLCELTEGGGGEDVSACGPVTLEFPDRVLEDRLVIFWDDTNYVVQPADTGLAWVAWGIYLVLVFVVWQGLSGMTPGKAVFGLRTVGEDGQVPGIGRALVRTVLWVVDGIGCVVPLVAPITAFVSKGHRRVGDMAAKTFVVAKASAGAPIQVPGMTPAAPAPAATAPGAMTPPPPTQAPQAQPPQAAPSTQEPPVAGGPAGAAPEAAPGMPPPGTPTEEPTPEPSGETPEPSGEAPAHQPEEPAAEPTGGTPAEEPAAAGPGQPQWDPQRNAYIAWDQAQQRWLQFDDATQQWRPIE